LPDLKLLIEIGPPLDPLLEDGFRGALMDSVAHGCSGLLTVLGLPGRPCIEVSKSADPGGADRMITLRLDGAAVFYPDELPLAVYCFIKGHPVRNSSRREIEEWLRGKGKADRDLVEWACLCCIEILKRRPGLLLSREIAEACLERLAVDGQVAGRGIYSPSSLHRILSEVLDLRISLAETGVVAKVIEECADAGMVPGEVVEELVNELRPKVIDIMVDPGYLRHIVIEESDTRMFPRLREGLHYELGMQFPDFRLVEHGDLGAAGFCFRINHLPGLSRRGMAPGRCMVKEEPEHGRPALLDPSTGGRWAEIDRSESGHVESGREVRHPLGYVAMALASDLRECAECFIDARSTGIRLDRLGETFPGLVDACRARYGDRAVTRVLRNLLHEGFSVMDLRTVLSAALDFDMIQTDSRFIVLDNRLPWPVAPDAEALQDPSNVAAFIRTEMKSQVSTRHGRGQGTLQVYLLSPEAERFILDQSMEYRQQVWDGAGDFREWFGEDRRKAIIQAIRAAVGTWAPFEPVQPILTTVEVRPWVRGLIQDVFPGMPVLAYQELALDLNIQVVERITPELQS
jgi:flagellar biosynthesis component FlhA